MATTTIRDPESVTLTPTNSQDPESVLLASLKLEQVRGHLAEHTNPYTRILALIASEEIVKVSEAQGIHLDRLTAWDDGNSIELIADCFVLSRRLELLFEEHSVTVTRVTSGGATEFPPARRPYNLAQHIGWLFGLP